MTKFADMVRAFAREEDGIALTEYLVLLGFFTAAVLVAVGTVGDNLATAWGTWGTWFTTEVSAPAAPAP